MSDSECQHYLKNAGTIIRSRNSDTVATQVMSPTPQAVTTAQINPVSTISNNVASAAIMTARLRATD